MLSWLGVAVGAVGVVSVVPALNELAYGFGLLVIVWLAGLGIVMLRTTSRAAESVVAVGVGVPRRDLRPAGERVPAL